MVIVSLLVLAGLVGAWLARGALARAWAARAPSLGRRGAALHGCVLRVRAAPQLSRRTSGRRRSRWTWRSSTRSTAARRSRRTIPGSPARTSTTTTSGTTSSRCSSEVHRRRPRGRATTSGWPLVFALCATAVFAVAARALCGCPDADGCARRVRRSLAGLLAVGFALVLGNAGRRDAARPRRGADRRLRLVVALTCDRRHRQRVPCLQLPARRPARARAGDAVRAPRRGPRAPARAERPQNRAAGKRPEGVARRGGRARARRSRARLAVRNQQPRLPDGHPARGGRASCSRRRAARRRSACAGRSCGGQPGSPARCCSSCPSTSRTTRRRGGSRFSASTTRSRGWPGISSSSTRSRSGWRRLPSGAGCATPAASSSGGSSPPCSS